MMNGTDDYDSKMTSEENNTLENSANHLRSSLLEDAWKENENRISPSLDDCIHQVVSTNGHRLGVQNETALNIAAMFTNELIGRVMASCPTWMKYVVVPGTRIHGKTAVLYKQDFGSFLCHVHLRRPTRLAAFLFERGRLPSMYGKVKVNPRDSKEQQMSVLQEWRDCTDKAGYFRSDMVLKWFNKGLLKAKKEMLEVSPRWSITHLVTAGGLVMMSVTGTLDQQTNHRRRQQIQPPIVCFNVVFVPCMDWVKVHQGLVSLPTSSRDPFPRIKQSLLSMSRKASKRYRCTIVLEAWNPKEAGDHPRWRLSLMKYETEILKLLDDFSFPFFTKDMLVLVESLVLTGSVHLSALTKQVLLQGLLNTMVKFQYERPSRPLMFLFLVEALKRCFCEQYLKQLLVPSVSVLKDAENYEMERTAIGLEKILKDITRSPEMLLVHTGLCSRLDTLTGRVGNNK